MHLKQLVILITESNQEHHQIYLEYQIQLQNIIIEWVLLILTDQVIITMIAGSIDNLLIIAIIEPA